MRDAPPSSPPPTEDAQHQRQNHGGREAQGQQLPVRSAAAEHGRLSLRRPRVPLCVMIEGGSRQRRVGRRTAQTNGLDALKFSCLGF